MEEVASQPDSPPSRHRRGRALAIVILVLALAGAALYVMGYLNSRRFYLVVEGDQLTVMQGIPFPVGKRRYMPKDATLQRAYQPIPIPPHGVDFMVRQYKGIEALDQALYQILAEGVREQVASTAPDLELAHGLLDQASLLPATRESGHGTLQRLRGDVAYREGEVALDQVQQLLREALDHFNAAATMGTERYRDAQTRGARVAEFLERIGQVKGVDLKAREEPVPADEPSATRKDVQP